MALYTDLNTSPRILLGPGPSMVHPRVLRVMATPVVGHLDPQFIAVMDDVKSLLRQVFQTNNELTIPVSGTGTAGMEAALVPRHGIPMQPVSHAMSSSAIRPAQEKVNGAASTATWIAVSQQTVGQLSPSAQRERR